jgi:hypothetical protein
MALGQVDLEANEIKFLYQVGYGIQDSLRSPKDIPIIKVEP